MYSCAVAYSGRGRLAAAVAGYLISRGTRVIGIVDRNSARREPLERLGVEVFQIQNAAEAWLRVCHEQKVRLIALAGYLALVPEAVVQAYPKRILNSHPALLPAFGGKGMYGRRVHEAVAASGAYESGFTIHFVSERYDEGPILHQVRLPVWGLSAVQIEAFIQAAEREIYPALVYSVWLGLDASQQL
ncbi:MAG: phosphoribosylglycinamide formyltransferase [Bacteroidia bacterium]|nr:phosphoribosylglycinamide formyltransferase [Bacteroidia bacterium]MCX7653030.1 formyltransferase family protein [Bacteroidia bacterium]MDW8416168.1 formyltransferase family protein [Bacteroidia bacterium]